MSMSSTNNTAEYLEYLTKIGEVRVNGKVCSCSLLIKNYVKFNKKEVELKKAIQEEEELEKYMEMMMEDKSKSVEDLDNLARQIEWNMDVKADLLVQRPPRKEDKRFRHVCRTFRTGEECKGGHLGRCDFAHSVEELKRGVRNCWRGDSCNRCYHGFQCEALHPGESIYELIERLNLVKELPISWEE